MRRLWNTVRALGSSFRSHQGTAAKARQKAFDEKIQGSMESLLNVKAPADAGAANGTTAALLKQPVHEIVAGRAPYELRELGNDAFNGKGVEKNSELAVQLWAAAALEGDSEAAYSLAMALLQGEGVPEAKIEESMKVLAGLARAGHEWAAFSLSVHLSKNMDPETTPRVEQHRMFRLMKQAAEGGVAPAYFNLYNMYSQGTGVKVNPKKALEWLKRAVSSGDPHAMSHMADRVTKGEGVEKNEKLGFELYMQSAVAGKEMALYNVGCAYMIGNLVPVDMEKAAGYFRRAAERGFYPAMINLGNMYESGKGVEKDLEQALEWFDLAAEQTTDAVPLAAAIRRRLEASKPQGGGAGGGAGAGAGSLDEAEGTAARLYADDAGLHFELDAAENAASAPTLDISLHVEDPALADTVLGRIQETGATTPTQILAVVNHFKAQGHKVELKLTDEEGKPVAMPEKRKH